MTPDPQKITIGNNLDEIGNFINEMIVAPSRLLHKWAVVTRQTPCAKIGYIGQHLASLITGVRGTSSGARGDDLDDGSEVKSCNRVDQLDKCKDCDGRVMRLETSCPVCGSSNIKRNRDSKWLFSVRDEHELNQYLQMDRIVLILMDYPNFDQDDFRDIRISSYELYPKEERMHVFCELLRNHYEHIYLPKLRDGKRTNPMNLHPFSIQFYKCNPILTFSCIVRNLHTNPHLEIDRLVYVDPLAQRSGLPSLLMPSELLKPNKGEWQALIDHADFDREIRPLLETDCTKEEFIRLSGTEKVKALPFLPEHLREYIPLREIVSREQSNHYQRSSRRR